jgi:rubrerythrin
MFDERALKELASIETGGPILSVYLNVDPTQRTADEYKLKLREILKQVEDQVDAEDIEAIKRYLEFDYDWSGRGLVIFSRQAEDVWDVYPLAVPVRSAAIAAPRPYISPLVELDGLYGHYAIALVDRQNGKFFEFQMGELADRKEIVGEDIHHTRKGRGSSVVGMRGGAPASGRHEAELVQRNLKEFAAALAKFCDKREIRHLLVGGSDTTVSQFLDVLPQALEEKVIGTFSSDMEAGDVELREHSYEILEEREEERHQKIADAVVTSAAKGMNGVVGLDQTLSVANEGRVQVLVVERDYHESGYRCTGCGYLTTQQLDKCVFCGSEFEEIPDAAEAVVAQVVDKGGTVEVVDAGTMEDARIGALLRY